MMHDSADRSEHANQPNPSAARLAGEQLLFGVIALQNNFITREQFVAAFDDWVQDKSRKLADILVGHRALTADERGLLDRLVAKFLEKHGDDVERSLAVLSSASQVRPPLEQLGDPDVLASLHHLGRQPADDADPFTTTLPMPGTALGRFRILRPFAKGGLGQVSVALDRDLNREVALKEIQPQHADNAVSRERFLLEAEITGGLEHPGIVPVYALGQDDDGRPFYAMRFVKGDSLKQAIADFHRPDHPSRQNPGARSLALRQLLQRFIDVCNAVEFAHSRGVLHRDLKPGNVMVGKYGETLVVDWGLAKIVGRKEATTDDESTLHPATALSSSAETQRGSAIGTPSYMSPEQAAGQLDNLGPATDVYSLGATLYHLLCGRPPFEKEDVAELLSKVQRGDFPAPRAVVADVPRPLNAICRRAMALQPNDRYPSARVLANEIEHWLADEPVEAFREGLSARAARWRRKHRGWVQAGGMALVLITVVSIVAAAWINHERSANAKLAEDNLDLARQQSKLADSNAALAESENHAKNLAVQRATTMQRMLARSYFDRGLREWDVGRPDSGRVELIKAIRTTDFQDPLLGSYRRVLIDRLHHGGRQTVPPLRHQKSVVCAAFSPDGRRVVTGSEDNTAQLWDAQTGVPIGHTMTHQGDVTSVAFSADGSRVVTGSGDNTARIWDAQDGLPIGNHMRHDGHEGRVTKVMFSPDGSRILTGSFDKTARLWDVLGSPIGQPMQHDGPVRCLTFSPDGNRIVTGGSCTGGLWDGHTGAQLAKLENHLVERIMVENQSEEMQELMRRSAREITCVAFSPDGSQIASGGSSGALLWNGNLGTPIGQIMHDGSAVLDVAFSRDGNWLVTGGNDHTVQTWWAGPLTGAPSVMSIWLNRLNPFLYSGSPFAAHNDNPKRHEDRALCVAFSPDGSRIVTGSADNTARIWDAHTSPSVGELMRHEGPVLYVAFSPDGRRILTASEDKTARLWDVNPGTLELDEPIERSETVADGAYLTNVWNNVAFSPDGRHFITSSAGTAKLWDTHTGVAVGAPMHHDKDVLHVGFSPDGSRIVTGSRDNTARLWNGHTGAPVGDVMEHKFSVSTAAFSPDGRLVATGSVRMARLWDAHTGASIGNPMQHHNGVVASVVFSPDGSRVASVGGDNTVRIWDGHTGAPVGKPLQHSGFATCVAFSPDGGSVVSGSRDTTARLWNAISGVPIGEPMRHDSSVTCVAFSPDGSRIVTGSDDETARIWDGNASTPIGEPMRHTSGVHSLAFSPDGNLVVTLSNELHFFDAFTGVSVAESRQFKHPLSIAFSPDVLRIASRSHLGTGQLWKVPNLELNDLPHNTLDKIARLWTGYAINDSGIARALTQFQLQAVRRELGVVDPLTKLLADNRNERDNARKPSSP